MNETKAPIDIPLNVDEPLLQPTYVDVALGIPQEEPFQYSVPKNLEASIGIGKRVKVPLRSQTRIGYIVGISDKTEFDSLKPIQDVIDESSFIPEHFLKLTKWMSEYYFCSWGQALEAALPAPFKKGKTTMKSRPRKKNADDDLLVHATETIYKLTKDQENAYHFILNELQKKEHDSVLLYGVTGSGKTEVYLRLIEQVLKEDGSAIVLVPEISLTPQTTDRFKSRFGHRIAVIHSRITAAKRLEEWHRIRVGEARVIVGARSALFSPVKNLRLLIIDEEHDDSYKQAETPRYDALLVAKKRCELEKAILLTGTATPRLESYYNASLNRIKMVQLPKRIEDRPLPEVRAIDMRIQVSTRQTRIFSYPLADAIQDALTQGEQVILFLNRRGFSPYVSCLTCGYVCVCPRCRVSLVFHHHRQSLLCHTCNYTGFPPKLCPSCQKGYIRYLGIGTEKVESEAHRLFPTARIARMDRDTTSKAGSHARILKSFRKREIDILLGTQMITKGHDFPGVSVVGVISADIGLHLPDFRSAERTFDLLTQVAGRAGRNHLRGKVFIQTYVPGHYVVVAAKEHDYVEFYHKEVKFREELHLPPFRNMIKMVLGSNIERVVLRKALEFKKQIEPEANKLGIEIAGPAPCLVSKRRGFFMWNIFYKGHDILSMNKFLKAEIKKFDRRGVNITVDVDPR